jgi:hypothetical protein
VNQKEIADHVIERLTAGAARDPYVWYPATGWFAEDAPFGLAAELFGRTWTNRQLDQLARVLFRLGVAGTIEVAEFRWRHGQTALPSRPHSQGNGPLYSLHGAGSRSLDVPNNAYAVRLATGKHGRQQDRERASASRHEE